MDNLNLAIIPARGGSKRIPNKNIIDFMGKPMIIWTLEAAQKTDLFSKIVVSTDSEEIISIVGQYGFESIRRPVEFASDSASLNPVVLDAFDQMEKMGLSFKNACMLMPNCPIRDDVDILNSYHTFCDTNTTLLMSVFEYGMFYPFWALEETANGLKPFFGEKYLKTRSQDLPKVYCPTGAIRWMDVLNFKREQDFYGEYLKQYVMPWYKAIDIDDYEDLEFAKMAFGYYINRKS